MAYASLLCLVTSIVVNFSVHQIDNIVFIFYSILIFVFTIKIRHMRCREVVNTFDSFAIANGIRFSNLYKMKLQRHSTLSTMDNKD
jgi:hypothetical protein